VKRLIESDLTDKAAEWARKGFDQTLEKLPGIAWELESQLRELAARDNNAPLVAAYRAMEFFETSSAQSYSELEKAAKTAGVWDAIRKPILDFLETGRRPDIPIKVSAGSTNRKGKSSNKAEEDAFHSTSKF
jgi:uncharacterized Zn finger protein